MRNRLTIIGVLALLTAAPAWADYNSTTGQFTTGSQPLSAAQLNDALSKRQPAGGDVDTQHITLGGTRQLLTQAFAATAAAIPTMAALRAVTPAIDGTVVFLLGYNAPRDAGGGFFVWSASNNGGDNAGSIINPTGNAGLGRWLRLLDRPGTVTPAMWGAVGDGAVDDSAAIVAADTAAVANGWQLAVSRPHFVNPSITLASRVAFSPGGRFRWGGSTTLTLNGGVAAADNQQIFDYPTSATLVLGVEQTVCLDWLYGPMDGTVDVSKFGNDLIASAPANGRDIRHRYGRWLLGSPLSIGTHNFIHITGPGHAWRSNIEYEKAPPAGNGATTTYPGGGAALLLAPGVSAAILLPSYGAALDNANYRVSGLRVSGLTLIGSAAPALPNNGIAIQEPTDMTEISDNSLINFSLGIFVTGADALTICGNAIAEVNYGLKVINSFRVAIAGNEIGATPSGISLDLENSDAVTITGNHIFPDGQVAENFVGNSHVYSIGNVIESRFTGAVLVTNTNVSKFQDLIRVYNFLASSPATDWTTGKNAGQPNYDPAGRDLLYGAVRVQNSNDNDFSGYKFDSQMPANSVLFRQTSGDRNWYNGIQTSGNGSNAKITIDAGADTQVVNSVATSEFVKNGGTVNFVSHVVGQ